MEISLEKIELVKDRTGVSYKEAKEALEKTEGNVVNAIILIEESINNPEPENKTSRVDTIIADVKAAVNKGNVSMITVRKGDKTILSLPVNVGLIGTVLFPWAVLTAAIAALGTRCTVELLKDSGEVVDVSQKASEAYETAKAKSSVLVDEMKDKSGELFDKAKEKGADFAEYAKDKSAELGEYAKEKGAGFAEYAKDKSASFGEYAKEKGADFAEFAKEKSASFGEYAKEKGADFAEFAKEKGASAAEYAKEKGATAAEYAKDKGADFAEYAKDKGADFVEYAKDKVSDMRWKEDGEEEQSEAFDFSDLDLSAMDDEFEEDKKEE